VADQGDVVGLSDVRSDIPLRRMIKAVHQVLNLVDLQTADLLVLGRRITNFQHDRSANIPQARDQHVAFFGGQIQFLWIAHVREHSRWLIQDMCLETGCFAGVLTPVHTVIVNNDSAILNRIQARR